MSSPGVPGDSKTDESDPVTRSRRTQAASLLYAKTQKSISAGPLQAERVGCVTASRVYFASENDLYLVRPRLPRRIDALKDWDKGATDVSLVSNPIELPPPSPPWRIENLGHKHEIQSIHVSCVDGKSEAHARVACADATGVVTVTYVEDDPQPLFYPDSPPQPMWPLIRRGLAEEGQHAMGRLRASSAIALGATGTVFPAVKRRKMDNVPLHHATRRPRNGCDWPLMRTVRLKTRRCSELGYTGVRLSGWNLDHASVIAYWPKRLSTYSIETGLRKTMHKPAMNPLQIRHFPIGSSWVGDRYHGRTEVTGKHYSMKFNEQNAHDDGNVLGLTAANTVSIWDIRTKYGRVAHTTCGNSPLLALSVVGPWHLAVGGFDRSVTVFDSRRLSCCISRLTNLTKYEIIGIRPSRAPGRIYVASLDHEMQLIDWREHRRQFITPHLARRATRGNSRWIGFALSNGITCRRDTELGRYFAYFDGDRDPARCGGNINGSFDVEFGDQNWNLVDAWPRNRSRKNPWGWQVPRSVVNDDAPISESLIGMTDTGRLYIVGNSNRMWQPNAWGDERRHIPSQNQKDQYGIEYCEASMSGRQSEYSEPLVVPLRIIRKRSRKMNADKGEAEVAKQAAKERKGRPIMRPEDAFSS